MDKREKAGPVWVLVALAVPLLYVLSSGPAIYMMRHTQASGRVFERVYGPLIWLHENTAMKRPLEAYGRFWWELGD